MMEQGEPGVNKFVKYLVYLRIANVLVIITPFTTNFMLVMIRGEEQFLYSL
jgi:hypothetical protein